MRLTPLAKLLVFLIGLALPIALGAQTTGRAKRRIVAPRTIDAIPILQTTDIHHHANGPGHVRLDAAPVTPMTVHGAYARTPAYVNYVGRPHA